MFRRIAGWSSPVARQAHNLKAAGSNPAPATKLSPLDQGIGFDLTGFFIGFDRGAAHASSESRRFRLATDLRAVADRVGSFRDTRELPKRRPLGASRPRGGRRHTRLSDQAERAISTGKLHALLRFHTRPINVVVFHGSSGRNRLEAGFPLRCLQRLSIPYIATLHCGWRHNRSTRDTFTPVLSY